MEESGVTEVDRVWNEWHQILFAVKKSQRYHCYREQFLKRADVLMNIFVLASGTAIVATAISGLNQYIVFGIGVTVMLVPIIQLLTEPKSCASNYRELMRRFADLEMEMASIANPSAEDLAKARRRRLEIEKDEPPPLVVLNLMCHNEQVRADGHPVSHMHKLKKHQRFFCQLYDLPPFAEPNH